MVVKSKLSFGDTVYIRNDSEQKEYIFVGLIGRPGATLYELSYLGEIIEVFEFETSGDKDVLKKFDSDKNGD